MDSQNGVWARSSFIALLESCHTAELENYLLSSDFAAIAVSNLSGLFAMLPDTIEILKQDSNPIQPDIFNGFRIFYIFFQHCMTHTSSQLVFEQGLCHFKSLFLEQVVRSSLRSSIDTDGSFVTTLYYLQELINITENCRLFDAILNFLLHSDSSRVLTNLCPRDIILSKLNSLSVNAVISSLDLLTNLLTKSGAVCLSLLFEKLSIAEMVTWNEIPLSDLMEIASKYSSYLTNADDIVETNRFKSYFAEEIDSCETIDTIDSMGKDLTHLVDTEIQISNLKSDEFLTKLLRKLEAYFSHSFATNLALTRLLIAICSSKQPILFKTLFSNDMNMNPSLNSVIEKLVAECRDYKNTMPNFEMRLSIIRRKVHTREIYCFENYSADIETLCNVVCLEEFIKEIAMSIMIQGD